MIPVETLNLLAALFTVALQVFVIAVIGGAFMVRNGSAPNYLRHIRAYAFDIAFGIALVSVAGSLYYSEIVQFDPCVLCWWQRIFMFPLVLLLGMAVWRRDRHIGEYALIFAAIGAAIAGYHYALEWSGGALPCPSGGAASCAKRYVFELGYVTIPLMSLSAFAGIITALLVRERPVANRGENK